MTQPAYSYAATLAAAQRVNWRVEDVIGGDRTLDFNRPFMPESLARVAAMNFLDADEKLVLNQIRGHGYLHIFGLVEEFILPFVLDHARPTLAGDDARTRALLQFAGEEAKHIDLFKRFKRDFEAGFGTACAAIGPPEAVAKAVLAHHPLAVALLILHIEWMTQQHYLESVRDEGGIDPQFKSLLRHHWMEEAQHAKLDTLMVEAIAATLPPAEVEGAASGYLDLGMMIDGALAQQVAFDLDAFTRATGRRLDEAEKAAFTAIQHQAQRWTFIGSGMTHPNLLATMASVAPGLHAKLVAAAPAFC
jgi:hypothetical protein